MMKQIILAATLILAANNAWAFSSGYTGLTGDTMFGCNGCHAGGAAPTVGITGPTTLAPGATGTYILSISEVALQHRGGLNIGATAGMFSTGGPNSGSTQLIGNEITHTAPKAGNGTDVLFSFQWTAPLVFTSATLRGWGNAVNFTNTSAGDLAAYTTLVVNAGATPTPTITPLPSETPTVTATPTPGMNDAVILPAKAVNAVIRNVNQVLVTKKLKVKVLNANPTGSLPQTIELAQSNECGGGLTISQPDFDPTTGGDQTSIVVNPGKTKVATVTIDITQAAYSLYYRKAANRCSITVSASFPLVMGNSDPSPTNNSITVDLNILDKTDLPEQSITHETLTKSLPPVVIKIPDGAIGKTKNIPLKVTNADILPAIEIPGHDITINDPVICAWFTPSFIDFIKSTPAVDNPITVKGGATKAASWELTVANADVSTPNKKAPLRCLIDVKAVSPTDPDPIPANNTTKLTVDVIDNNDF